MVKSCVGLEMSFYGQPYPEYTDPWAIKWRYVKNEFGVFTESAEHPLAAGRSKLEDYEIPDPNEETQYDHFRRMKDLFGDGEWLIGSNQRGSFSVGLCLSNRLGAMPPTGDKR